jgi:hypothetical protein
LLRNILYLHLLLNDLICFCIYPLVSHIEVSNALCFMCLYVIFFLLNDQLLLVKFCGFQCLKKFPSWTECRTDTSYSRKSTGSFMYHCPILDEAGFTKSIDQPLGFWNEQINRGKSTWKVWPRPICIEGLTQSICCLILSLTINLYIIPGTLFLM